MAIRTVRVLTLTVLAFASVACKQAASASALRDAEAPACDAAGNSAEVTEIQGDIAAKKTSIARLETDLTTDGAPVAVAEEPETEALESALHLTSEDKAAEKAQLERELADLQQKLVETQAELDKCQRQKQAKRGQR